MHPDTYMISEIHRMNGEFLELTGHEAYGYVSEPTPTSVRVAFQDGTVKTKIVDGYTYMTMLLKMAKNNPAELPYPFDQKIL